MYIMLVSQNGPLNRIGCNYCIVIMLIVFLFRVSHISAYRIFSELVNAVVFWCQIFDFILNLIFKYHMDNWNKKFHPGVNKK